MRAPPAAGQGPCDRPDESSGSGDRQDAPRCRWHTSVAGALRTSPDGAGGHICTPSNVGGLCARNAVMNGFAGTPTFGRVSLSTNSARVLRARACGWWS
eukprot:scaffold2482_cov407-Prasinococcus_capsulatus_cf.AAC.10